MNIINQNILHIFHKKNKSSNARWNLMKTIKKKANDIKNDQ